MDNMNTYSKLGVGVLALKNLRARPVRTACLVIVSAILAATLFGGSMLALNLRQGLDAMTRRFGADLMVVPEGAGNKAQSLLLRGGSVCFYFNGAVAARIAGDEHIARASPQFFLTSLAEACCDAMVQLIAYDPATDFVVQPWIAEKYRRAVGDGEVVTGSRISIRSDHTIRLLGHNYPVAARLSPSAGGLDTAVFMTMNTMRDLAGRARAEGYSFLAEQEKQLQRGAASAVLVKAAAGVSPQTLAKTISAENPGVEVMVSHNVFSVLAASISGLTAYIHLFMAILWVVALAVLAAVFSGMIHERKKEFALLRIIGATRKKLIAMVLTESVIAGIAGGLAGLTLASLAVFPFAALIGERLQLPYLAAPFFDTAFFVAGSLCLSALAGPLASFYAALRISKAETYFTMREGE